MRPVLRFAPSPNGLLHLGHAYAALLNHDRARAMDGRLLLRIEDIDPDRCRPEFEIAIYRDLAWLGVEWEWPVRRQSDHIDDYRKALVRLRAMGLVYPAFLSRSRVKARVDQYEASGAIWPRDPDGTPHYPDDDRDRDRSEAEARIAAGEKHMWRLDMQRALSFVKGTALSWRESGSGMEQAVEGDPSHWGDVIVWRRDTPSSYHLSVVVDDALQGVTHVVRGMDLYPATSVHRLLQVLLDLPQPTYRHHPLILGEHGEKLSKSIASTGLQALREAGLTPSDIRRRIGLLA